MIRYIWIIVQIHDSLCITRLFEWEHQGCIIYHPITHNMFAFSVLVDSSHKMCSLSLVARCTRKVSVGMKLVLSSYSWLKSFGGMEGISDQFMAIICMCEVISGASENTQATLGCAHLLLADLLHQHADNLDLTLLLNQKSLKWDVIMLQTS